MDKIKEFAAFSDEEFDDFERMIWRHNRNPMLRLKEFYESIRDDVLSASKGDAELKDAARMLSDILERVINGFPFISVWIPGSDGDFKPFGRYFKEKVDTDRISLETVLDYERGSIFIMVFDEAECRAAGMRGAVDRNGRYLCSDGTFLAPTMNFINAGNGIGNSKC